MMNANELKAFPVTLATGGATTSEKAEVVGAKVKGVTTTAGGFLGALFMAPANGAISFVTDICALCADIYDSVRGKGGD